MNFKSETFWLALIGAGITVASALGITTGSESADLTTAATQVISGVLGLVSAITAIVTRRKAA